MASEVISPELIYKPVSYRHGSKMYTRIVQQTGGSTISIPVATSAESIFEIPVKAFYMGDSYIQGVGTPSGPGGAGLYNWFHKHTHVISELHLMTRGGVYITQLYNADRYRVLTRGFHVQMEEFMAADDTDRFKPSRMSGVTADVGGRVTATAASASAPYTEIQYAERGNNNAQTPVIPFTIRLSDFHDTIFALKKALLLPEIVLLRVVWGPLNRFSWVSSDPTDPTATAIVPAGALTVNSLYLYLSVEQDPSIISDLMKLQTAGYRMAIPWVYCNRQVTGAPGADNSSLALTVKVTPDMGFMVKQLVYGVFNNTDNETKNTAQDHQNVKGARIRSYQTTLDSVPRQQFTVSCGADDGASPPVAVGGSTVGIFDDWKQHERMCRGTAIQSRDIYQYNWFHCEDFSDVSEKRLKDLASPEMPKENIYSGIPIVGPQGSERIWTLQATTSNTAFVHYTFMVTYKTLTITPTAVMVTNLPPGA